MNFAPAPTAYSTCSMDSTGAHQHLGASLGDALDGLLGGGGAEGDLRHGQTAGNQRLGKGNGVLGVVQLDHGHDAQGFDLFAHFLDVHDSNSPLL